MNNGEMVTCSKAGYKDIIIRKRGDYYEWAIAEDQYGKRWSIIQLPDDIVEAQIELYKKESDVWESEEIARCK